MNNQIIRDALSKHQIKQWELAEILQINEFSLSRKLRHELPEDEQKRIVAIIEDHCRKEADTNDIQ